VSYASGTNQGGRNTERLLPERAVKRVWSFRKKKKSREKVW